MQMRGRGFVEAYEILRDAGAGVIPAPPRRRASALRLAVMHMGGPAPGMNTAVRAAVRLGLDRGHTMLGVRNGLQGLLAGRVEEHGLDERAWLGRARRRRAGHQPSPAQSREFGADRRTLAKSIASMAC
jgi:6-phosphofructokinase 1